jgi:ComF family protein
MLALRGARRARIWLSGRHSSLRNLTFLRAPFRFAGTGGRLVRRFKLDGDPGAGYLLASAMRQSWMSGPGRDWQRAVVCSVPLHRSKLRARGFDQAAWLAQKLAQKLAARRGWSLAIGLLKRTRATLTQGDVRTTSRQQNVAGAFQLSSTAIIRGRRIVLVDDVFTSGATLRECALLLREAGAREVGGQVACRS